MIIEALHLNDPNLTGNGFLIGTDSEITYLFGESTDYCQVCIVGNVAV